MPRMARGDDGKAGRRVVKVTPWPGVLCAVMVPPWAVTSWATTASPMPEPAARSAAAIIAFEDVGQVVGGDAGSGVGDGEFGPPLGLVQGDGDRAAGGDEFQGVGQLIGDDLGQPHWIRIDPHLVEVGVHGNRGVAESVGEGGRGVGNDVGQ